MSDFPFLPLDPEPRVGIFWSYQNNLFHAESSPITEGMITSISVDYKVGALCRLVSYGKERAPG